MKSVWKVPLVIDDAQTVTLPVGAELLTVQVQRGEPCLWARVDPRGTLGDITIRLAGTGHPIDDDVGDYVGTFQMHDGDLVFHVFGRPLPSPD